MLVFFYSLLFFSIGPYSWAQFVCFCQIAKLLRQATENRAVAATKCNERSSRSHFVFMMNIEGSNTITSEACQGKNLCISSDKVDL